MSETYILTVKTSIPRPEWQQFFQLPPAGYSKPLHTIDYPKIFCIKHKLYFSRNRLSTVLFLNNDKYSDIYYLLKYNVINVSTLNNNKFKANSLEITELSISITIQFLANQ